MIITQEELNKCQSLQTLSPNHLSLILCFFMEFLKLTWFT